DRAQAVTPDVHQIGLVVVDPVGDVGGAGLNEVIERVPALLQAGREPPFRAVARRVFDAGKRRGHDRPLLARLREREQARVASIDRNIGKRPGALRLHVAYGVEPAAARRRLTSAHSAGVSGPCRKATMLSWRWAGLIVPTMLVAMSGWVKVNRRMNSIGVMP